MDTDFMKRLLDWFIKVLDVVLIIGTGAMVVLVICFFVLR
jgi:hypothetical protein